MEWRGRWPCVGGVTLALVALAQAQVLNPPYFNLAEGKKVTATSTCGISDQVPASSPALSNPPSYLAVLEGSADAGAVLLPRRLLLQPLLRLLLQLQHAGARGPGSHGRTPHLP